MDKRKLNIIFVILSTCIIIGISIVIILSLKNNVKHERNIEVINYSGNIKLIRDDEEITVDNNTKIKNNDNIITNEESYLTIKFDSDKYLYVDFNTNIIINTNKNNSKMTTIRLNEGFIVSEIQNELEGNTFDIITPNSICNLDKSVFSIKYEKKTNYINLNYKLVEGVAKVNLLHKDINNEVVNKVYDLESMHILSLSIFNDEIIDNEILDDSINSLETLNTNRDSRLKGMFVSDNEVDYDYLSDVIEKLIYNHNKKTNRLVCVSSTFNFDNGKDMLYKFDSKDSFDAYISLFNKQNYKISGYEVNGEVFEGKSDLVELNIEESTLVKPIYTDTDSYSTEIVSRTYENNIRVNFDILESKRTINTGDPIYLEFDNSNHVFLGWYELGDTEILLSTELRYIYVPSHSATICAKYADRNTNINVYDSEGNDLSKITTTFYSNNVVKLLDFDFYIKDVFVPSDLVEYKLYKVDSRTGLSEPINNLTNEVGSYKVIYNLINNKDVKSLYIDFNIINYVEYDMKIYNSDASEITYVTDKNVTGTISTSDYKELKANKVTLKVNETEGRNFLGWYSLEVNKLLSIDYEFELKINDTIYPLFETDEDIIIAKYLNQEIENDRLYIELNTDFDMNDIVLYYSLSINNTNHLLELDNNLIETTILELYNGDYEEVSEIDTTYEASGEGGHYYQILFYYNNSFVKTIDLYVYQSFMIVR